jgi:hypothetical protein
MTEMSKKLINPFFALLVTMSLAIAASADGKTYTGHIVDKACSGTVVKGGVSTADAHSGAKGCAKKEGCEKSGYGIYADGKWTAFDAKGNELAKAALAKATKDTGVKFDVVGELKGDTLEVTEIKEAGN